MGLYHARLTKTDRASILLEADSADQAKDVTLERYHHGTFFNNCITTKISITVFEDEPVEPSNSEIIRIYWDDIIRSKQEEILRAFGDNNDYDVVPIQEIPIPGESDKREDE